MADIVPVNGLKLNLPEILNIPPKLLPMITRFNEFRYFLLDGGRGSAKSHSVARFLLYLGEQRKLRIVCGREQQNNIEESVYTILKDLIEQHKLAYTVFSKKIVHVMTGTTFTFKGFRDQGSVSIKGMEGIDILWIDEAQSVTAETLKIIIPTIRKDKAKIFFTMNRYLLDDAVPEFCRGRNDCLHIEINYYENPHCPMSLKIEAEEMRRKSQKDYDHIWMNKPLRSASDYLFDYQKLYESYTIQPSGSIYGRQRILGIDFAAEGDDQCVATVLDRITNQHWEIVDRIPWDEPNTMISVGKIVAMIGDFKPTVTIIDKGGLGKPVYDRLIEVKMNVVPYDGGSVDGVDQNEYGNIRSQSYHTLKEWFDNGWLIVNRAKHEVIIKELEKIRRVYRSNGVRMIEPKKKMKEELGYSPDNADSLNMAVWGACTQLGKPSNTEAGGGMAGSKGITRKTGSNRHKL